MQHYVLGLDVAVHNPVPVRVVQRGRDRARHLECLLEGERRLALQPLAQRLPFHVGHDVVEQVVVDLPRVVQRNDVGMLQARRDVDLPQEPLGPEADREVRMQHLDCHRAAVPAVLGHVHRRHAPAADLPLDAVPAGQRGADAIRLLVHQLFAASSSSFFRASTTLCTASGGTSW